MAFRKDVSFNYLLISCMRTDVTACLGISEQEFLKILDYGSSFILAIQDNLNEKSHSQVSNENKLSWNQPWFFVVNELRPRSVKVSEYLFFELEVVYRERIICLEKREINT